MERQRHDPSEAIAALARQRDELIGRIERQMRQVHRTDHIFMVRWTLT